MRKDNKPPMFDMFGKCVDTCQVGGSSMVANYEAMACTCKMGMHPKFRDNCDMAKENCFEGCHCPPGTQQNNAGDCQCENPNQMVSSRGCIDDNRQQCDARGSSVYFKEHGICMIIEECPPSHEFEGCGVGCRMIDFFDPAMAEFQSMGCMDCKPGYHHVKWHNKEVCASE
jgi:hypothetical protein